MTTGADVLVQHLIENDVDTIFAITGAGNLAIIDAIVRQGSIKIIYSHHEQAVVMEAQGYSRVSGKIGVALVTTGGGTSNVVTGVLSAYLDSVPVIIISGNESSFHCANAAHLRAYGVQGFDSVSVLNPVVKLSKRIENPDEVSCVLEEAFLASLKDRQGPSHIDFPMDIQRQACQKKLKGRFVPEKKSAKHDFSSVISAISEAKRPLFYFGNGCRNSISLLRDYLEIAQIPYAVSWSALDMFNFDDPLNIGTIGIYGSHSGNIILQKSDLLVCIGTRLAIPQIGYDKNDFARHAKKIVVDIDESELSKFENLGWTLINETSENALASLSRDLIIEKDYQGWKSEIFKIKQALPLIDQIGNLPDEGFVHSAQILKVLPELLFEDAVMVTDVGAPLLNGHYIIKPGPKQRLFTSQGLGEMGFGLPGAIGAHFAFPRKQIVCLNTDGAIMFNLQELQVVKHHKIPLKLFIFNNSGYGMIKISQENLFDSRLSGSDTSTGISFPDFKDIANTFGFNYVKINSLNDLISSADLISDSNAQIFDVIMDPAQKYFPRLATNKLADGKFVSPPIEDLTPFIPIKLLEELLGYTPTTASFEVRGIAINGQ